MVMQCSAVIYQRGGTGTLGTQHHPHPGWLGIGPGPEGWGEGKGRKVGWYWNVGSSFKLLKESGMGRRETWEVDYYYM